MATNGKTGGRITLLHPLEDKKPMYRKFNPDQPRKKPFYDTKRKVLVIPEQRSGHQPSGRVARGGEASGIPAAGERGLSIRKKWDGLAEVPRDVGIQNKLGMLLLEAVSSGEVQDTGMFAIENGLNPYKFHHMADENEYFSDCLQMARYIIGAKMVENARSRKEDGSVNMRLLGLYNLDYRKMVEEFKQSEASKAAATVVIMEKIPDSPLVPQLRKNEDG